MLLEACLRFIVTSGPAPLWQQSCFRTSPVSPFGPADTFRFRLADGHPCLWLCNSRHWALLSLPLFRQCSCRAYKISVGKFPSVDILSDAVWLCDVWELFAGSRTLFRDAGFLSGKFAQVIQFGAAYFTDLVHYDAVDVRTFNREYTFNSHCS